MSEEDAKKVLQKTYNKGYRDGYIDAANLFYEGVKEIPEIFEKVHTAMKESVEEEFEELGK